MFYHQPKKDPRKNFYMVPNAVMRLGLSAGELAVYNYLLYCEDRSTYQCYPSHRTMGEAIGLSQHTVLKHVKSLEEKCLITTERTTVTLKNGKKQNGNLLYTIRPIQEAIDCFHDKQLKKAQEEYARWQAQKRLEEYDRKHGIVDEKRSSL